MRSTRPANTVTIDGKRYVCRIYDNGGETLDRYTIALKARRDPLGRLYYPYLASSTSPFHSFGQHGESEHFLRGGHLGTRVAFEDVPEEVREFIRQGLKG